MHSGREFEGIKLIAKLPCKQQLIQTHDDQSVKWNVVIIQGTFYFLMHKASICNINTRTHKVPASIHVQTNPQDHWFRTNGLFGLKSKRYLLALLYTGCIIYLLGCNHLNLSVIIPFSISQSENAQKNATFCVAKWSSRRRTSKKTVAHILLQKINRLGCNLVLISSFIFKADRTSS